MLTRKIFENFAGLAAVTSFLALLLSALYNLGFFVAIDIDFIHFLTINDYGSSGLAYLPATVVAGMISMFSGMAVAKNVITGKNTQQKTYETFKRLFSLKNLLVLFGIQLLIWFFLVDWTLVKTPIMITGVSIFIFGFEFIKKSGIREMVSFRDIIASFMVIILALGAHASGLNDGYKKLRKPTFTAQISLDGSEFKNVAIVRLLDRGAVFIANNKLQYASYSDKTLITVALVTPQNITPACKWLNFCRFAPLHKLFIE